jgi:malic enzyme
VEEELKQAALDYHRLPQPGKISLTPTKALANQRDLSLAYSPGVAYASLLIRDNPLEAANMTARANLVAVVTNGTAVLGLGNIGPLASKPVMEGKGCLFKKFAVSTSSISSSLRPIPTDWWILLPRWSPPSAASTSKTSRHPSASTSSASCASA